ncbi:MAG: LysR family transcriptional regulator [Burkholderiaceae bacterium]
MDQLAALRLFIHVARSKNISSAGRALGLSTTTASKRLQDFEALLGVRLVDRTTRQVSLTEAGERLLARSADMLDELQSAFAEAREMKNTPSGTLRILARRSFGLMHVAPALLEFRKSYPQIGIDLALTEDTEIAPGRGIDIAIRLGAPNDKTVVAHQLTSAERQLCASPSYLARAGSLTVPADLSKHDCLTYRRAAGPAIWIFRKGRVEQAIDVSGPLQANSGEVLRGAAVAGLGLVLLPDWMVASDVAARRLRHCLGDYEAFPPLYRAPIYAVHRRGEVSAKIAVFVVHLKESMKMRLSLSRKSGK